MAQTVIMAKVFNRNVRSTKYFHNPKQYSTFRSLYKMPTDSLRAYPGGQPDWTGKNLGPHSGGRGELLSTLSQRAPHLTRLLPT